MDCKFNYGKVSDKIYLMESMLEMMEAVDVDRLTQDALYVSIVEIENILSEIKQEVEQYSDKMIAAARGEAGACGALKRAS